ncbi:enoyl-CoA hydratase/isomerase family protein [Amycolatopsis rubida]|uniref:Enoyl-CoA hydratase/isomerase family protein n=1 Tax=Amycolatopsis rubida TaxID=112413 RepID=A0ABX0C0R4_9PSEU|nr:MULTISPECIES: enoyl-CoA hydratase/isomerase family protein [Amycolatopsis]MYW96270.1 enoyl-CoA hydratase/isomerase family protein [Amycolatopsis rubida]NEC61261.1 enoyl-CoA hydratase/isomerase family protein [Amycolatopsis rubida]OAP24208.1 putative enoyl-CoA hydratase echA8 [Amycolatopsis sp. M39]
MTTRVRLEISDRVATVRLDAPPLNAFDTGMRRDLADAAGALAADPGVRAVVLYGGPRCFAAGADVKQLAEFGFEEIAGWNRALQQTFTRFAELPVPVVAAVTGYALGGGMELALAADFRIAAEDAVLGLPEVLLGIIPGSGGTQRLTRLVGRATAKELMMTGRRVPAREAADLGIVDRLAGDPYEAALSFAKELAAGPRFAIQAIKEAVDQGADLPIAGGLALERSLIAGLFATADRDTGMASFLRHGPGKATFGEPA